MTVRKRENGKWYVAKLEKNHNHELVTPAMRHFLRSYKEEDDPKKSLNGTIGSMGVGLNASVNVSPEEYNSFGKLGFAAQNNVNFVRRGRLSNFGVDAQSLLAFVKVVQTSDPAFYYAIQVDDEDRLSSVKIKNCL